MKTVNSLSGGKTSSYIAANYPADYNVFSLVRTDDKKCLYPDKKIRQIVSDKIGIEFIGTLEQDSIIQTMLDLEQKIGKKIDWVTGITFEKLIEKKSNHLPNIVTRYCTTNLKLTPMFHWWYKNINEPIEMRIGFRANETRRAKKMISKLNKNGLSEIKETISKNKNGTNHWETFEWQKPTFPLIEDQIYKDKIEIYWNNNKDVKFKTGYYNNCVGCFHRNPIFLKKMHNEHPNKIQWFADQEDGIKKGRWKSEMKYKDIIKWKTQTELSFDDFTDCDSGYCGL